MKYRQFFGSGRKEWVIVVLAIVVVLGTGAAAINTLLRPQVTLRLGDGVFTARLARTNAERTRGLGGTSSLGNGEAMLFVFDRSDTWGIWMKDMSYPIDVVWLNEQKQVVYSVSNMQPDSYPETYLPKQAARYVVELPAGTVRSKAIGPATVAQFALPEEK